MKTRIRETNIRGAAFAALAIVALALLPGCANDEGRPDSGKGSGALSFTLGGISEGESEEVTRSQVAPESVTQELGEGLSMTCTLTPGAGSRERATSVMATGNKYKLVVLDGSGKIVGSVDGVAGTQTPSIGVAAGTYTVIAYSYNDNSSTLPDPGAAGSLPSGFTVPAGKDLLYWSQSSVVVGASESKVLPITFSHKCSKVNVVVDASLMDASVNATTAATLGKSYDILFSSGSGSMSPSGAAGTTPVSWNTLGAQSVTSDNVLIFSSGETPLTLTFSTLTIGATAYSNKSVTFSRALESGKSYTLTVSLYSTLPLPSTITLAQNQKYFVASVYDDDYLPYTVPTVAATTGALAAGGSPETPVDVQGSISTTGVNVLIPVASAPSASGRVLGYKNTVTVPSSLIQGGGRPVQLTLSWLPQDYDATTKYITATIKAVGSDLNAIKLDINNGVGNDQLGVLLAQFSYPYNSGGSTTTFQVRDIPGIPDRKFGQYDVGNTSTYEHQFLYLPITAEDGNIWLSNNLGADYANLNSGSFSLTGQATAYNDYHAYGSLFQWGRNSDGHELINWTSGTAGSGVYGTTSTPSSTDTPATAEFITSSTPYDWRNPQNDNLWQGVAGTNNPCPTGFRMPTNAEQDALQSAAGITNSTTAASSKLKFSAPGKRSSPTGALTSPADKGLYWSSSVDGTNAATLSFDSDFPLYYAGNRGDGYSVRCIKN